MADHVGDVLYGVELDDADLARKAKATGDQAGTSLGKSMSDSIRRSLSGPELKKGILQGLGLGGGFVAANAIADGLGTVKDAFVGSVQSALAFEQGMRNVNSIAKLTEPEFQKLSDTVLGMGGEFGQSAQTMVDAMYDINSSGFEGAEALDVLEASARAATAGMATTGEAAAGITAVLNAYGLEAEEAGAVSDVLFKTVERGVVTFPELSAEIGKTTALAAPLGVTLEEVGAALAVMTRAGIDAENATTQLNAIMASLLKPSKEASDLAEQLGIDWSAAGLKANGLVGTLQEMIEATNGSEEEMAVLLGDARAIRGAFSLVTNEGKELNEELAIMEDAAGATGDAFGEQSKGAAFKLAQASARLEEAGIEIGQHFLPILADLATFVSTEVVPVIQNLADVIGLLSGEIPESTDGVRDFINTITGALNPLGGVTNEVEQLADAAGSMGRKVEQGTLAAGAGIGYMADASKDDLYIVQEGLEDTADDAEEVGAAAQRGARDFRTAVTSTLDALEALRAGITGDAAAAAAALFDPLIAELQVLETQEEIRANNKKIRDAATTEEEKRQLQLRNLELQKSLIEQQALVLTYGTEAEQISKIKAFLASKWWAQAYADATPEQRMRLDEWKMTLQERLDAMEGSAREGGGDLRDGFIGELQKGGPKVKSSINSWSDAAGQAFKTAQAEARAAGYSTGAAYAAGLRASYGLVNDAAYFVGHGIGPLKPSSPPPAVPWIIDAGYETGKMWAEGLEGAAKDALRATRTLAGAAAAGLGMSAPYGLSSAVSVPGVGSVRGISVPSAAPVAGAHYEKHNHVHVEGLVKATTPFKIATTMERFENAGLFQEPWHDDEDLR